MAKKKSTTRKKSSTRTTGSGGRSASGSRSRSGGTTGSKKSKSTGSKKKTSRRSSSKSGANGGNSDAAGKHLVIVESPAKARTINKYLGKDYLVKASVGHVRDLPKRAPKGETQPVPGVDMKNDFQPTYETIYGKNKTVSELKRTAKQAEDVYLATDLDREGEAIAWHLVEALGVPEEKAKRVVFNAITRDEIQRAFENPHELDMDKVNAQQARRILDRIVGYQVSPLLWKKVAGGLSAGRVQSVATRLIVEREREIEAFVPAEYWKIGGYFTVDLENAPKLAEQWRKWLEEGEREKAKDPKAKSAERTVKERNAWLSERGGLWADLIELDGQRVEPTNADEALELARLAGFELTDRRETRDEKAKGPAQNKVTLLGRPADPQPDWHVRSIETKRTRSKPYPPFITSTLQQTAANQLNFPAQTTMRTAQQLYEGVDIKGQGSVGLITYMRTDSTHLSSEAVNAARDHVQQKYGRNYLPEKPNRYRSSNQSAQEAHEAIRPTDVSLSPEDPAVKNSLDERQLKLYRLIYNRFLACQMVPAEWDSTTVLIGAKPNGRDLVFRCTGRRLVFDGFFAAVGVPRLSDELTLPELEEGQKLAAIDIEPQQKFTNPPPRYTEASLVKKLEAEGIGRPSTYAQIIQTIQDRNYVEKISGRFHATDLGKVVTDKLMEGFPKLMEIGYTRWMEDELDAIEQQHHDWIKFLHQFYEPFKENLEQAHEQMTHAKAETEPAPYECPQCGAETVYRFGKNGKFLSCSRYPDCKYAAQIDREGKPVEPEETEVACPECGEPMEYRKGRYGPFLSCKRYPECKGVVNLDKKGRLKHPTPPPLQVDELQCPKCEAPLYLRRGQRGPWLSCSRFPKCRGRLGWSKLEEDTQQRLEQALAEHEKQNPQPTVKTVRGEPIGSDYTPQPLHGDWEDSPAEPDVEPGEAA